MEFSMDGAGLTTYRLAEPSKLWPYMATTMNISPGHLGYFGSTILFCRVPPEGSVSAVPLPLPVNNVTKRFTRESGIRVGIEPPGLLSYGATHHPRCLASIESVPVGLPGFRSALSRLYL